MWAGGLPVNVTCAVDQPENCHESRRQLPVGSWRPIDCPYRQPVAFTNASTVCDREHSIDIVDDDQLAAPEPLPAYAAGVIPPDAAGRLAQLTGYQ